MARNKKTLNYLKDLQNKDYDKYGNIKSLYDKWKNNPDDKSFSDFFKIIGDNIHNIIPKYLSSVAYNVLRGTAFEEFCHDILDKIINEIGPEKAVKLFWNQKIVTDEFYMFEDGEFKKYPKYKAVDITIGKKEDKLVHPIIIISCKTWLSTNWLDEDIDILNNIRNRYPDVFGYSLCW